MVNIRDAVFRREQLTARPGSINRGKGRRSLLICEVRAIRFRDLAAGSPLAADVLRGWLIINRKKGEKGALTINPTVVGQGGAVQRHRACYDQVLAQQQHQQQSLFIAHTCSLKVTDGWSNIVTDWLTDWRTGRRSDGSNNETFTLFCSGCSNHIHILVAFSIHSVVIIIIAFHINFFLAWRIVPLFLFPEYYCHMLHLKYDIIHTGHTANSPRYWRGGAKKII